MLQVKKYDSIQEIDPNDWDSIPGKVDYFHSHHFIRLVEESKVENAKFQYLLIHNGTELVGTTVLSVFNISLDLFISNSLAVRKIKQAFPNFFSIKLITCGLPASFGQLNIKIKDGSYAGEVCSLVASGMKLLAKENGVRFMAVKELRAAGLNEFSFFEHQGFFPGNSIPYMNLSIRWKTFNDYLSSLRHTYRRRILLALNKMENKIPRILPWEKYDKSSKKPSLVISVPAYADAAAFYKKYLCVMSRTPTKLETLNLAFFENLFERSGNIKMLSVVVGERVISSGILVVQDDTVTFMLAGREREKDDYDSYFNLVYGIIAYAIESGCKYLKLGQTAYWLKQSVGAEPENEYLYFASTSWFWHAVISKFRNAFFPPIELKDIRVFRESNEKENCINSPKDIQQISI